MLCYKLSRVTRDCKFESDYKNQSLLSLHCFFCGKTRTCDKSLTALKKLIEVQWATRYSEQKNNIGRPKNLPPLFHSELTKRVKALKEQEKDFQDTSDDDDEAVSFSFSTQNQAEEVKRNLTSLLSGDKAKLVSSFASNFRSDQNAQNLDQSN